MASRKQQRKAGRRAKKAKHPGIPGRHPDGDRRRRGTGMTYEQGQAIKQLLQQAAPSASNEEEE